MTDRQATGNPEYALAELGRAILAIARAGDAEGRARAEAKAARWRAVIDGMISGSLAIGSRAPVSGTPRWATLDVAHGGFGTGTLLANGPLQPHEIALRDRLGKGQDARTALNLHFVSDAGRGDGAGAERVLDPVTPFFDRLRFYPVPNERPVVASSVVKIATVSAIATQLGSAKARRAIEQMHESIRIWLPLYDRIIALFLETIEDGWPCRRYAPDFRVRAEGILADYRRARTHHTACNKPDKPRIGNIRHPGPRLPKPTSSRHGPPTSPPRAGCGLEHRPMPPPDRGFLAPVPRGRTGATRLTPRSRFKRTTPRPAATSTRRPRTPATTARPTRPNVRTGSRPCRDRKVN
jgi:hypothetical protein